MKSADRDAEMIGYFEGDVLVTDSNGAVGYGFLGRIVGRFGE